MGNSFVDIKLIQGRLILNNSNVVHPDLVMNNVAHGALFDELEGINELIRRLSPLQEHVFRFEDTI